MLRARDPADVLAHVEAAGADRSQARKNLSALPGDQLPTVWTVAKNAGDATIDALVLISIIFSHRDLIQTMINAEDRRGTSGRIDRDIHIVGKSYTNFARIVAQLGYACIRPEDEKHDGFGFDLAAMFSLPKFGILVAEILALKLKSARWNGTNTLSSEAIRLGWNDVFGITPDAFRRWLERGSAFDAALPSTIPAKSQPFKFKAGHNHRKTQPQPRTATQAFQAKQLHNELQNRLYDYLVSQLGAQAVGTEVATGYGSSIDLVTYAGDQTTFYEIKTADSARASIRQALPQLLEYAFWPAEQRASRLVIVTHLPLTADDRAYLKLLQQRFSLPLSYQRYDQQADILLPPDAD